MKKRLPLFFLILLCFAVFIMPRTAFAKTGRTSVPPKALSGVSINSTEALFGASVTQLVMVCPLSGPAGELTVLEKNGEKWTERFKTPAVLGVNGLGKTAEGDGKTPVGIFRFTMAFGIRPDPGCTIGYRKVAQDDYWCGDSASVWYNRYVTGKQAGQFDPRSSEHLIGCAPEYNYALNISYNEEGTPGKGSAIFLHCFSGRESTSGCVSVSEARMKELLKNLSPNAVIVIDTREHIEEWKRSLTGKVMSTRAEEAVFSSGQ